MDFVKKRSYIYHILKSLLPEIRYNVYDELYELCNTNKELFQYLPYKQTLILINFYKNRQKDFSEEIVYNELNCKSASKIYNQEKNKYIPAEEYISNHTTVLLPNNTTSSPSSSTPNDQSYIYSILRPLTMSPINENGTVNISIQTNPNDLINITNTVDTTDIIDAINRISISNTIDTINSINAIDTNVTNHVIDTIDITDIPASQNNIYYTLNSDSDSDNATDNTVNELPQITIDSYLLLADIEEYINHYNYSDADSDT